MHFPLLVAAFAGVAAAAPAAVCSQAIYKALLPLSQNAFVEQFCSSKFPVAPVTITPTTSYTTATQTAFTTTTLSTTLVSVITVLSTDFTTTTITNPTTITSTITQTAVATSTVQPAFVATVTTTVVTDASGNVYKRAAEPTIFIENRAVVAANQNHGYASNTRAQKASAAYSSFAQALPSIIKTACSCIETPKTLTATATSTVSTVSTNTISITTTLTSLSTTTVTETDLNTSTAFSTFTSTTTTTIIQTTTIVASPTQTITDNVCGTTFSAPVTSDPLEILCGQTGSQLTGLLLSSTTTTSFYACLLAADQNLLSTDFTYQFSTGACNLYQNFAGTDNEASTPNAELVFGVFYP